MSKKPPLQNQRFKWWEHVTASVCGDNCAKWILKIAESKDLTINLRHIMEFGDGEFEMKILNTGEVVHNMLEFVNVAGLYV